MASDGCNVLTSELQRGVRERFKEELQEERRRVIETLASLRLQAEGASDAAAVQILLINEENEEAVRAVQREARAYVVGVEREERQHLEAHKKAMLEIEEMVKSVREEADARILEIERETEALHMQADIEVLKLNSEQVLVGVQARQQCSDVAARLRVFNVEAKPFEEQQKALAKARIDQLAEERVRKVQEVEQKCNEWLHNFNAAVTQTQSEVASELQRLLEEGRQARGLLAENRERADGQLDYELQKQREAAHAEHLQAVEALKESRRQLFQAEARAYAVTVDADQEGQMHDAAHAEAIRHLSAAIEEVSRTVRLQASLEDPAHAAGLKRLAEKLRAGRFTTLPPSMLSKVLKEPGQA